MRSKVKRALEPDQRQRAFSVKDSHELHSGGFVLRHCTLPMADFRLRTHSNASTGAANAFKSLNVRWTPTVNSRCAIADQKRACIFHAYIRVFHLRAVFSARIESPQCILKVDPSCRLEVGQKPHSACKSVCNPEPDYDGPL